MDHHGSPGAGVASIQHALTNVTSDGRPLMEDPAVMAGSLKHSWDAHGLRTHEMPGLGRRGRVGR